MNDMFGLTTPKHIHFYQNLYESFAHLGETDASHIICFFIFFIPLYSAISWKPRIPWIAVICVIGIVFGVLTKELGATWGPDLLMDKFPDIGSGIFRFDQFDSEFLATLDSTHIAVGSLAVCFICILESFIAAKIAETATRDAFRTDKEVFCTCVCNFVCGILGGTPGQGVIVRTTINI